MSTAVQSARSAPGVGLRRAPLVGDGPDRLLLDVGRRKVLQSLDFEILRAWSNEKSAALGFDPRRSPELIAKGLGVSPATVRRRVTDWRARGFLLGYEVLPHPALLGGRLAARMLGFPNPVAQAKAVESLSLIDGVIQIEPARNSLLVVYYVDSGSQGERRLRQFQATEGTKGVSPEMPFEFPPCVRRMSRPDWRLVLALRRHPEASVSELAEEVGQSPRTTSRRFDSLLDSGAVIFDLIFEFSRFYQTLAALAVTVEPAERREEIERQIRELFPQSLRAWGPGPPDAHGKTAVFYRWVTAPTAAALDELTAQAAHIPGVSKVLLWYGRATLPIRPWLDERIETILRLGDTAG
jgi:DNA-binding Lrp family transcriptional regulator